MIRFECDRCGRRMDPNDPLRFIVRMEVFAAAEHIDLEEEPPADTRQKLQAVLNDLATADPDEVEDQTYRAFRFDVCDDCRRKLMAHPLG